MSDVLAEAQRLYSESLDAMREQRIRGLPSERGLQAASGSERAGTKRLPCGRANDEAA